MVVFQLRDESGTSPGSSKNLPPGVKFVQSLAGHRGLVTSLAFDPLGRTLASGSFDGFVKLWEVTSGKLLHSLKGHQNGISGVAFNPEGGTLASGSYDNTVIIWETTSGEMKTMLKGHILPVTSVSFRPDGNALASASWDRTIKVWDTTTGKLLRTLVAHKVTVNSVSFHPDGWMLASASNDQSVKRWEAISGKLLHTLERHTGFVRSVAFDPAGQTLASASDDQTVKLWEPSGTQLLRTLEGHTRRVEAIAFSAGGKLLASKSADGTIRLWNCETWKTVGVIPGLAPKYPRDCAALAFHPTLPLLAAAWSQIGARGDYQLINLWELDLDVLLGRGAALQPATRTVNHTSAKIVLIGESNVGKSCLAMRIAEDRYPTDGEHGSTHGMRFWAMRSERLSPSAAAPAGERRDVVLWDLGGQDEYRLVHQLFLNDTTVALVLLDPSRGRSSFEEAEAWNRRLEQQLQGRRAVKLLVGTKADQPNEAIDRQGIEILCQECGFSGYFETSAFTTRGISELREAIARAIDWNVGVTSRPEFFQRTRDEIQRRQKNEVVLHLTDLYRALLTTDARDREKDEVIEVTRQLAAQGVISLAQLANGEIVLVLQVQEIERYAGSLILAARNNPRGVPALELRAIAAPDLSLPKISASERLPRGQERTVLDCTVQLLVEHGICFQHEGLLVFPTLFDRAPARRDEDLSHAVSLYYDFSGAIDNTYASLVSWLVLTQAFGRLRLEANRAEFEIGNQGLCGLRKVPRPRGFAHIDIYFESETPPQLRDEFISFVEGHLRQHGIDVCEYIRAVCPRGFNFDDETLRMRVAAGHEDVMCPRCDHRHPLTGGVESARERDPDLATRTWALKTTVDRRRRESATQVIKKVEALSESSKSIRPLRLLHLSDLHFTSETSVSARLQALEADLRRGDGMAFDDLDYLIISGDFTNRGEIGGFEKSYEFVSQLTSDFGLSAERCIFVPGNHDVVDTLDAIGVAETQKDCATASGCSKARRSSPPIRRSTRCDLSLSLTVSSTNSCCGHIRPIVADREWQFRIGIPACNSSL